MLHALPAAQHDLLCGRVQSATGACNAQCTLCNLDRLWLGATASTTHAARACISHVSAQCEAASAAERLVAVQMVRQTGSLVQGGLKERIFAQHYLHGPPVHRALLTLSEVVVSTAGPSKEGEEAGANKGRTRFPKEWDDQQRLLQAEVQSVAHASKPGAHDGVRRGVSALAPMPGTRAPPWWQATALKHYADLRGLQQRLEGQSKVRRRR